MTVLQLLAERGRHARLRQKATTVDNAPLAGDRSTAVDQQPAQNGTLFEFTTCQGIRTFRETEMEQKQDES
jgi:hypothetical protein